ncbi:MAG: lipopolysaccharide heptosyltransferase II [Betaproteobacteria bacterium]|nr:MAG: lipopolysaccharide heptosyltransferase II [Betaproteobacteria bacterium]
MPKILIVAPNWIGDALLAQPLFARLRKKLPGIVIDALAPAWTAPVLRRMPEIDEVIESPFDHGELALAARWRLGRSLRSRGYDEAIVLPNSFKSALVPFFAGIPLRAGFAGESRYGLLNVVHKLDAKRSPLMAERYAQLAEKPGTMPALPLPQTRLAIDEANLVLDLRRLGLSRAKPIAAFCPGAEYGPSKRWPARHFAALARKLSALGYAVWLFGSERDRAIGEEISAASAGAATNLCGGTDLASAIDLLSLAEVVVSNDSGLMHVAAGVGRPVVALYGSSSPEHTPPLARSHRIVRTGIECSPCFARECPLGHFKCMNELAPERVMEEIAAVRDTA